MKKQIVILALLAIAFIANAQDGGNAAQTILSNTNNKVTIGGYAQVDYNQKMEQGVANTGTLDVHRMVMLFGYRFNERTNFVTELELEHVKEVYVEQAFMNYKINDYANFRTGLMLVPMGIINEYHEPPTFNGVERPNLDKYIVPTTWREIGAGFAGTISEASVKYQLYVMNGFNGYANGAGTFSGKSGLRSGRQKGAASYISSPTVAARVDFFGINGLKLGASGYFGKSQSDRFNALDKSNTAAMASADSSVVNIAMLSADARYSKNGFGFRAQYSYINLGNTEAYNQLAATDVASALNGWYTEASYNVFGLISGMETELIPFVRYENYNTHASVSGTTVANEAYNITEITTGLGWKVATGAILKLDYNLKKAATANKFTTTLNAGVGIWF